MVNMEILKGLYRTKHAQIVEEKHGGVTIKHEIYWYLCFYVESLIVGLYGTGAKESIKWYFSKAFDQSGTMKFKDNHSISISINKLHSKEHLIFEGQILEKKLRLKAYHEGTPNEIWLEDEFEYLDLDYEKLEKEFNAS